MVATAIYSVTMVLWKETAFPLCRAMERRWKRNVVSRVSSVIVVIRLPISCVSSITIIITASTLSSSSTSSSLRDCSTTHTHRAAIVVVPGRAETVVARCLTVCAAAPSRESYPRPGDSTVRSPQQPPRRPTLLRLHHTNTTTVYRRSTIQ